MRSVEEIKRERRQFAHENDGRVAEQLTARVDELVSAAKLRAERVALDLFAGHEGRLSMPSDPDHSLLKPLLDLYMLQTPQFRDWLLVQAKQASKAFCGPLSLKDYEAKLAGYERELEAIDAESIRVEKERRRAALEHELAGLDTRINLATRVLQSQWPGGRGLGSLPRASTGRSSRRAGEYSLLLAGCRERLERNPGPHFLGQFLGAGARFRGARPRPD